MASSNDLLLLSAVDQTEVTMDILGALAETGKVDRTRNAVVSPLSVVVALAMAAAGAQGETLSQITNVLKLPRGERMHKFVSQVISFVLADGSTASGPVLSFAAGAWVEQNLTLKSSYKELLRKGHGAEIRQANFLEKAEEERIAINAWVREKTKGKIEDILPSESVTEYTRLVLANALYFKGKWARPFESEDTKNETFYLLNGETVTVPFLTTTKKQYIREYDTHKILKLPYATGEESHRRFSMYVVLPTRRGGLPELEISLKILADQCSATNFSEKVAVERFLLPKFKITTEISAVEPLKSMGLRVPFSPKAEFIDMVEKAGKGDLCVDDVLHKAFVEVNEEGTEAAASTLVLISMVKSLVIELPVHFEANHPFLLLVKEDITGIILFIGRITNPSLSN